VSGGKIELVALTKRFLAPDALRVLADAGHADEAAGADALKVS
jgi:hypothetical protein